ncbi:hypothetical protein [Chamaesiphon sp.]
MPTNSLTHSQTASPLHPSPIEQLDDLISPFLVPPQQQISLPKD